MARKKQAGKKAGKTAKGRGAKNQAKGKARRSSRDLVDHALMKALVKPLRAKILAILAERVASPKELANELSEPLSNVCYHVRVLRECGVIELDRKEQRRGAVEHFHRFPHQTVLPPGVWDALPSAITRGISAQILREFFDDAVASMEAGVFDDPAGELNLTPLILDALGLEDVGQLTRDFLKSVLKVQAEASKRLLEEKGKGTEAISATVFLASFLSARGPEEGKKASATKRR